MSTKNLTRIDGLEFGLFMAGNARHWFLRCTNATFWRHVFQVHIPADNDVDESLFV
jgi:hypothetical protein